jgi:hypothetical protein
VIHGGMKLERLDETDQDLESIWRPFSSHGAMSAPTTKRTSQRLFRDHPRVRFLVSTEAGGEGINLQVCHICVNYDLPWNPMRVEQRVGRIYRFGQEKVVQVYQFVNRGTIEDLVQTYFEDRLERAANALAGVTGEDWEDIKGTLNGQLEAEIDPSRIYERVLVEGNLNKQTKDEIARAVERARQAYGIATKSLFRDVTSYSFDKYKRELATDLTLTDLQRFTERFLTNHRRQIQKKRPFIEFLVPDVLAQWKLKDRYREATFDREVAIQRSDAEFLAIGHPLVDTMLEYVGSYDFGGLTALRRIVDSRYAGLAGYLFVFVTRKRISHESGDECVFQFAPVFVRDDGTVDADALEQAVKGLAESNGMDPAGAPDPMQPSTWRGSVWKPVLTSGTGKTTLSSSVSVGFASVLKQGEPTQADPTPANSAAHPGTAKQIRIRPPTRRRGSQCCPPRIVENAAYRSATSTILSRRSRAAANPLLGNPTRMATNIGPLRARKESMKAVWPSARLMERRFPSPY